MNDDAAWLVEQIAEAKRMASANGRPQLANSAIEAGRIEEYDQDGTLVQIVGEQHDGTHTPVTVNGPVPPEPSAPAITAGIGSVEARWSGKFAGDALSPMDLSHVALHASRLEVFTPSNETQLATITGELGDVAVVLLEPGEWSFALVAVSKAGKWSEMSETVTVDVPDYPSPVDIQDELIRFDEVTGGLQIEAGNLGDRLDQAQQELTAHAGRLGTAEQRVTDAFVQISTADGKATAAASAAATAQTQADTAKSAADQAAADALAAAGLAGSKGEVIYQLSAPTGTRANPANLWIRTTDNKPHTYNATAKAWVAVTDKAATDAATAAANAKSAADAAAQAAANAQTAAGSAQNTADNALTMAGTKGKVFYSTSTPSGTGTAEGDLWRRVDGSKNVIGEWYWSGSAWVSSQITTSAIANLDVGKLTVGTGVIADLVAQSIAASTAAFQTVDVKNLFVTTGTMAEAVINKLYADVVMSRKAAFSMLAVGDFQNYLATGLGFNNEAIDWAQDLTPDFADVPEGLTVAFSSSAGQGTKASTSTFFDVNPGDEYEFVVWVKADKPNSRMYIEMRDQSGAHAMVATRIDDADLFWGNSSYPVNSALVPTSWTKWRARLVPKAGVRQVRIGAIYFNHTAGTERGATVSIAGLSVKRRFGGEVIVDGSLKSKQIDVEDLAANTGFIADLTARIVKSEMFVGKEFFGGKFIGSYFWTSPLDNVGLKIDSTGFRAYGPEGGEPVTEIRADGGTVYSITDPATGDTLATMGADGGIAGQALDIAQDPVFMGMPLLGSTTPDAFQSDQPGILDYLPRGNVAYAARNVAGIKCSNGNRALLEFSFDEVAGRSYQVTVQPVPITSTINTNSLLRLFSEVGTSPGKPTFSSSEWYRFAAGGTVTTLIGGTFLHNAYGTGRRRVLVALFTGNQTTTILNQAAAANLRIVVTDIGPIFGEVGIDRNDSDENGVIVAPPPPAPEKKNYTKTYEANGWRSYRSDGSTYNYQTSRMYQGNSPAVGALRSNAVFPSMISDLSGATITSVEAHFYFDHWYYPQGGTARIHLHSDVGGVNDTIAPQTYAVQSGNWKPGSGRWVKIPSQFWNGFKNGDYTGVGLGGTTTAQYGYARGSSTRIRIKYTK
ncbi:hypothetical protein [Glutamicibacter soli]|uniref:hypothetical protein n=1 Tax=Glutamicibacter soli TaxID=453836 RepID=UPI003FD019BB